MLTLYLACLAVGGALIALSLLGGGEADAELDADVTVEAEAEAEAGADGEGFAAAARFLSLRNLVFFAAFFGLTGTLLTLVGTTPAVALAGALGLGGGAAAAVHHLMAWLRRTESGALRSLATLAGARARVLVGLDRQRPGKVTVATGDGTHQLVARIHEAASVDHFAAGDTVVVVRFQDGVALVAEPSFLG